jgi:hypothetical protein
MVRWEYEVKVERLFLLLVSFFIYLFLMLVFSYEEEELDGWKRMISLVVDGLF